VGKQGKDIFGPFAIEGADDFEEVLKGDLARFNHFLKFLKGIDFGSVIFEKVEKLFD
jgi:hypothetical protein